MNLNLLMHFLKHLFYVITQLKKTLTDKSQIRKVFFFSLHNYYVKLFATKANNLKQYFLVKLISFDSN